MESQNKFNENTINEKSSQNEELIEEFKRVIKQYHPNWKIILHAICSEGELSFEQNLDKFVEIFRQRMKEMRKSRGLTQQEVAYRLSCSKQYVSKIENSINNIPIDILDNIQRCFSLPIPYLLGLTDDSSREPDIAEYYFWENPDDKFNTIKEAVIKPQLIYPMETWGPPPETLESKVAKEINGQYDILMLIDDIMNSNKEKKEKLIKIMIYLNKIL